MLLTHLMRGVPIDVKHVNAFRALAGLGACVVLDGAWQDHREDLPGTFGDAVYLVAERLRAHSELVIVEKYSRDITRCDRCRIVGAFAPADPDRVVQILGYW
jgi:hypothetical protein